MELQQGSRLGGEKHREKTATSSECDCENVIKMKLIIMQMLCFILHPDISRREDKTGDF